MYWFVYHHYSGSSKWGLVEILKENKNLLKKKKQ